MRARHGRNTLAVGIVLAGLLTGCGEDDGTSTPTGPTTVTVPSNRAPQIAESIPDTSMFIGITRGTVHRYQEDSKNPGTPACANRAARNHAAGLEMVIGGRTASDPDAPNSVAVP